MASAGSPAARLLTDELAEGLNTGKARPAPSYPGPQGPHALMTSADGAPGRWAQVIKLLTGVARRG